MLWPARMLHLVLTEQPEWFSQRRQCNLPRATDIMGSEEGADTRRALYLGIGSYVFYEAQLAQLLQDLVGSRNSPSWLAHFRGDKAVRTSL